MADAKVLHHSLSVCDCSPYRADKMSSKKAYRCHGDGPILSFCRQLMEDIPGWRWALLGAEPNPLTPVISCSASLGKKNTRR